MKKTILWVCLLLLFLVSLSFASCSDSTGKGNVDSTATTATATTATAVATTEMTVGTTSVETTVITAAKTTAETTTAVTAVTTAVTTEEPETAIPDSYFERLDMVAFGTSIVIPAKYNDGIACDIYPTIQNRMLYFLLPSTADLSQVVYELYDQNGELRKGRVADFTSNTNLGKQVSLNGITYTAVAFQSDSPALYLEIDEAYGSFEEVKADKTKNTKAYGKLILECREDIAEQYGWDTSYVSMENDSDSPCSMYIKGRGNWTWLSSEKQGFSIKLEKKDDLLGMSKSKKWALIGNTTDNTMLRNTLASYLSQAAGFAYTPSGEIVDLFVNGEYYGAFLLSEKVDINENRVNITDLEEKSELLDPSKDYGEQKIVRDRTIGATLKYWTNVPNPEDITGGYILEMEMSDRYQNEPSGFTSRRGFCYVIKSPEYASEAQVRYIAGLMQEMEDALFSSDGINPKTGKAYTDYMDLDSFVKKYWIDEISKNRDGAKTSHYLYKPADSESTKLFAGPVWDYDIAFGISAETVNPEGWFSRQEKDFYKACLKHDDFEKRANELFFEIFYPAATTFITEKADLWAERIEPSVQMNDIIWQQLDKDYYEYVEDLKSYLQQRITWIKNEITP